MRQQWYTLVEKAKTLPPGHVGKEIANQAVAKEYSNCEQISRKWSKRLRRYIPFEKRNLLYLSSPNEILHFCNTICNLIGSKNIKKIVLYSTDVSDYASAHYCLNEIHFKYGCLFDTLIHELCHHIDNRDKHGKYYCQTLEILWQIVFTYVTNKQPHSDWLDS